MFDRDQALRCEDAIHQVFNNQFQVLTDQLMETHDKLSKVGEKWSTKLLLILGAILLVASLLMKIDYPYGFKIASLSSVEFTTLIIASAGLLFVGALFSLLQAWSWRRILRGQQELGIEILKKQVDIDKEVLTSKDRRRGGELIVLPTRIVKRHRH